ncbi:MAG TPA: DUF2865 domain-containing protein [Roseiarcus sp.]|nr:DUF2865 domain-containing protein [Roseiarcus sp.]
MSNRIGTSGPPRRAQSRFDTRLAAFGVAVLLASAGLGAAQVMAQSAECQQLRAAIAATSQAPASHETASFDAAAQKQRAEIDRTLAYSRQIGCDRHKFLFFGNDPPPQCGEVQSQIARMQANLGQLQARGSGGGDRGALLARYQAECANQQRPTGFFEALFGRSRQDEPQSGLVDVPISPDMTLNPDEMPNPEGLNAHAGSKAVCVRSCDGYFFPVSYSAGGHMNDLQEMCHALCPNAEVALYSYSPSGDIDQAVSIEGARYVDLPNAFKYRKTFDGSCSCRRRGQSWAQALQDAENLLGEHKNDIIVTQEKSDELARVRPDAAKGPAQKTTAAGKPDAKGASPPPPQQELSPTEQMLGQQPATMSRETSGIAAGDATSEPSYNKTQGQTEEVVGPDGVKRRVRIIDPTL